MKALMQNYAPMDICFDHGSGVWLYDKAGTRYLDGVGGIAVCILGHAHPAIQQAVADQAARLLHTSNLYRIELQEQLAQQLTTLAEMERVFFANSGAEANEAAIKLARLHGHAQGYAVPKIIVMQGSFHGRTMATLSATGNPKVKQGFEPVVEGFIQVPYNDVESVEKVLQNHHDIAAILCEPIQGEGGIVVPDSGYLGALRALCDQHHCLLMIDEVQTGMGRTGRWFAHQHESIKPDVMTLAKALGNGIPIGACLAANQAAGLFTPGSHGSTFGGNPLAARAALAVIEELQSINAPVRSEQLGQQLIKGFQQQLADTPGIVDIRGKGLMIGIELDRPCHDLVALLMEQHCLINVTASNVIRLLPAVVMEPEQAQLLISTVVETIKQFLLQESA